MLNLFASFETKEQKKPAPQDQQTSDEESWESHRKWMHGESERYGA